MTQSTGARKVTDGFIPIRLGWSSLAVLTLALLAACSNQDCSCSGFTQQPFPEKHYDKTVERSGQIRITETGLAFLEQEIPTLIKEARPQGLNFCVERDTSSDIEICVDGKKCNNGKSGCQFELTYEDATIRTDPDDTLLVDVTIGGIDEKIPFNYDPTGAECLADLKGKNGSAAKVDATVPIRLTTDDKSELNNLAVRVGEIDADLGDVDYDIESRGGVWNDFQCTGADIGSGFVEDDLKDQVESELNTAVQEAVREQTCTRCGDEQPACEEGTECHEFSSKKYCKRPDDEHCKPKPLGVEGRIELAEQIGDLMVNDDGADDMIMRAADTAEVDSTGLTLGVRAGFQQDALRKCAPVEPSSRPSLDPIALSSEITTDEQPNGDSFMMGAGFHENAIEQMLWTTWASGSLCLRVGSDFSEQLSTTGLSVFLMSLSKISDGEAPVFLKITPQTAPEVELGDNVISEEDGSYSLEKPLVTLNWKDLDLHFYAFVQDRFTRLYTTRTDLELPVALRPTGMGEIVPVVGDLEEAPTNLRIRHDDLLAESKSELKDLIPTLLSAALPSITDQISEPIELPTFFGYQLALEQEDITSIDNNRMIALFANLKYVGSTKALAGKLRPRIVDQSIDLEPTSDAGTPRPVARLRVSALRDSGPTSPNVEFSYRVDDGFWSLYTSKRPLEIQHPALALPGEHRIEVRARYRGDPGTASRSVETSVRVDYRPPELAFDRQTDEVVLDGRDAVDPADALEYRYRFLDTDGEPVAGWSTWRSQRRVSLPNPSGSASEIRLEAEARDRSGHVGSRTETFELDRKTDESSETDGPPSGESGPAAGCSASGGGGSPVPFAVLVLGLLAGAGRRSRWRRWAAALLAAGALALGGCGSCATGTTPESPDAGGCADECEDWETCQNGTCVATDCSGETTCPEGSRCENGECEALECTENDECDCPSGERPVCKEGVCDCAEYCPDGCGDNAYCCYNDNQCRDLPDPCNDVSCDPGYEPKVVEWGEADSASCEIAKEGSCECKEKPPLDLQWYGRYTSTDAEGDVAAVSTYNKEFGDLMVGVLNGDLEPTWYLPDGVPDEGTVVAAPSGPRGGLEDEGEDVGTHTAIAVDTEGRLHVLYRNEENTNLYYARGASGSEGYSFEMLELDTEGTPRTATATIRDGTFHGIYSTGDVDVTIGDTETAGSQIRHVHFPADTAFDQLDPEPTVATRAGPGGPCLGQCSGDQECFVEAETCAEPTDDCDSCSGDKVCRDESCETVYSAPAPPTHAMVTGLYPDLVATDDGLAAAFYDHTRSKIGWMRYDGESWGDPTFLREQTGPYASIAVDGDDEVHLAFMDRRRDSLRYRDVASDSVEKIVGGTRDSGGEYLVADIGHDVDLWLQSDGAPRVAYQDASKHALFTASRSQGGSWDVSRVTNSDADGAHGFYAGSLKPDSDGLAEMVIDQKADPPRADMEFHQLP